MASTVTAASLTTTATEAITLNSVARGSSSADTIASVGEIFNQITSIATTGTDIIQFAAAKGAGVFSTASSGAGKVEYMRFTNLDNSNYVDIVFSDHITPGSAANICSFRLEAGKSILLGGVNFNATSAGDDDNVVAANDTIANVRGIANTDPVDIEVYVASL